MPKAVKYTDKDIEDLIDLTRAFYNNLCLTWNELNKNNLLSTQQIELLHATHEALLDIHSRFPDIFGKKEEICFSVNEKEQDDTWDIGKSLEDSIWGAKQ